MLEEAAEVGTARKSRAGVCPEKGNVHRSNSLVENPITRNSTREALYILAGSRRETSITCLGRSHPSCSYVGMDIGLNRLPLYTVMHLDLVERAPVFWSWIQYPTVALCPITADLLG
jgi:hypothetical protein